MPVLANARYERFAQIVAGGKLTPTAAYRETLGANARDPDVNSCRWMKKPPIAKRIAELKGEAADKCSLSREAYIRSLVEMYEAKPSEASMDNPRSGCCSRSAFCPDLSERPVDDDCPVKSRITIRRGVYVGSGVTSRV